MKWNEIIKKSNKILMVENSLGRIKSTLKKDIDLHGIATTNSQFESMMATGKFNTLWLDYDLDRIFIPNHEKTINVIEKHKDDLETFDLIVIHSWNPFGARALKKELQGLNVEIIIKKHWCIV